ncbi:uncharacterized protein IL334_005713 [Kwoniella shivajii]|uniref:BCS1 N-terminal domain-containing protein n=1 Tax=Kwoniella shivajii TaxID=564305 RepID=A0ABZ1D483_9TREE|nr:hypothetical protein IL334_005713 [Kwoniella shivajii]
MWILPVIKWVISMIRGNPLLNEGIRFLLAGSFFEFSRRFSSYLMGILSKSLFATARISENDQAFEWIYHYLSIYPTPSSSPSNSTSTSSHSGGESEDDFQNNNSRKTCDTYSFVNNLINQFWQNDQTIPMDVQLSTKKPKHHGYGSGSGSGYGGGYSRREYIGDYIESKSGLNGVKEINLCVTPSLGTKQRIKYNGRIIKIGIVKGDDSPFEQDRKWIIMTTFLGTPTVFTPLIHEARKSYLALSSHSTSIYTPHFGHSANWIRTFSKRIRPWESVFLPDKVKDWILKDAKEFLHEKDFYLDRGTPWRRGYLCFGVAGSGKSSLISAIAAKLKLDIYLLNLGAKS